MIIIGFDATNIGGGGGLTHLKEIVNRITNLYTKPKIIIFGSNKTLAFIPDNPSIIKHSSALLNKGIFSRLFWQIFNLTPQLKKYNCDILFTPGGSHIGSFHPHVTMCQNMLVFDSKERSRYKYSKNYWRLLLLSLIQSRSFKNADGIIFISDYAFKYVTNKLKLHHQACALVPHGISSVFFKEGRIQISIKDCTALRPFKLLYISTIDLYKHQWVLVRALHKFKMKYQVNIELQFAGPQYPPAMRKLVRAIKETKLHENIKYIGELDHKELHKIYSSADAFVFLSSCENMPNTLMEAMRSELPILCSDRSPMNEFLKDAGWYCNPEDADSVALGLEAMLLSQAKRRINAKKALSYSNEYSWEKCAMETYDFIMTIAKNNKCAE